MKQIIPIVFLVMAGCFVALFAYTNKQTTQLRFMSSITIDAICTLYKGRHLSVNCQPDLKTMNCSHFPQKKCPFKKIKKLKNMAVSAKQHSLAESLLQTPQKAVITLNIRARGRITIKQILINNHTLYAD